MPRSRFNNLPRQPLRLVSHRLYNQHSALYKVPWNRRRITNARTTWTPHLGHASIYQLILFFFCPPQGWSWMYALQPLFIYVSLWFVLCVYSLYNTRWKEWLRMNSIFVFSGIKLVDFLFGLSELRWETNLSWSYSTFPLCPWQEN